MEAFLGFGGIGRAHPRLDAIERRFGCFCPGDDGRFRVRHRVAAVVNRYAARRVDRAENNGVIFEPKVANAEERGVVEWFLPIETRNGIELAVGDGGANGTGGGDTDGVVTPGLAFGPRCREVKVVTGAPRDGFGAEVAQGEFAREGERSEMISDRELVVIRVGGEGFGVGYKGCGKTGGIEPGDLKPTLTGEAMHGHGPTYTGGIAPEINVAVIEASGIERKQNGVAAADAVEVVEGGEFGPVEDIAYGSIAQGEVPVHEACTAFGQGEERRITDAPAVQSLSEVGDLFHVGCLCWRS